MSTDFSGETKHLHAKRLVHTAEWGGPPTESHAYIVEITVLACVLWVLLQNSYDFKMGTLFSNISKLLKQIDHISKRPHSFLFTP